MIDLPDSNAVAIQEVIFRIEIQKSIGVFYSDRDVQFHRELERHSWFFLSDHLFWFFLRLQRSIFYRPENHLPLPDEFDVSNFGVDSEGRSLAVNPFQVDLSTHNSESLDAEHALFPAYLFKQEAFKFLPD